MRLGEEVFKDVVHVIIKGEPGVVTWKQWFDFKGDSMRNGYQCEWVKAERISLGRKVLKEEAA